MLFLVTFGFAAAANAQDDKTFPSDDDINLVLTQTDRAMQQYAPLVDQERIQLGKNYGEAADKDQQVVSSLEMAVKAFRTKPQAFNGPLGFAFFEWLDDASRNAALCSAGAMTQSTVSIMAGDKDTADALVHLSQSCIDASALIYTVSENAGSLYQRYTDAEDQLATQSVAAVQQCADILKKSGITPKPKQ
jgi:hypothetical protein